MSPARSLQYCCDLIKCLKHVNTEQMQIYLTVIYTVWSDSFNLLIFNQIKKMSIQTHLQTNIDGLECSGSGLSTCGPLEAEPLQNTCLYVMESGRMESGSQKVSWLKLSNQAHSLWPLISPLCDWLIH